MPGAREVGQIATNPSVLSRLKSMGQQFLGSTGLNTEQLMHILTRAGIGAGMGAGVGVLSDSDPRDTLALSLGGAALGGVHGRMNMPVEGIPWTQYLRGAVAPATGAAAGTTIAAMIARAANRRDIGRALKKTRGTRNYMMGKMQGFTEDIATHSRSAKMRERAMKGMQRGGEHVLENTRNFASQAASARDMALKGRDASTLAAGEAQDQVRNVMALIKQLTP